MDFQLLTLLLNFYFFQLLIFNSRKQESIIIQGSFGKNIVQLKNDKKNNLRHQN